MECFNLPRNAPRKAAPKKVAKTPEMLLQEMMDTVCPPNAAQAPRPRRNFLDPDQNSQFHSPQDFSSQGSILVCKEEMEGTPVQCAQALLPRPDSSIPATETPQSSQLSHVSCTPGMEFPEGSMLNVGSGTGGGEVFQMYTEYNRLYGEAQRINDRIKAQVMPRMAACQLDAELAADEMHKEESALYTEMNTQMIQLVEREERYFRALQRQSKESREELTRMFHARLHTLERGFNLKIQDQHAQFRQLRAELEALQNDWVVFHRGMHELYCSAAQQDAMEAMLMGKHLKMKAPNVSPPTSPAPACDRMDLAVVPGALFDHADLIQCLPHCLDP